MLPILSVPEVSAAADLAVALDGLLRRVGAVPLPRRDLDGWASLCAGEYRAAVDRLSTHVGEADEALRSARRAIAP